MDHDEHLRQHDARMARYDQLHEEHVARMAKMDRQYEKLLEVQLDQARSHDEHIARMDELQSLQRSQTETLEQMRLTLDAVKEILRDRRN